MEASDVQSPEGDQGADGGSGLYDLNEVPQELREQLEPHLKAIEGNATRKFQEHAAYRDQWQPYEELGINQVDPQDLAGLLEFAQMAQDDNAFAQWFEQTGQESGLFEALGYTKEDADLNDLGIDESQLTPEQIADMVREAVAEQMAPVNEQLTAQQQEQLVSQAEGEITDRLAEIHDEYPDLPETADDAILRFAYSYAEDDEEDPVGKGFEDYQNLIAQGEGNLFAKKAGQPSAPEGPGAADPSGERITSFGDPRLKQAARERLER